MRKAMFKKKLTLVFLVAVFLCFNFGLASKKADAGEIYSTKNDINKTQEQIEAAKNQLQASQSQYQTNQVQIAVTRDVIAETQAAIEEKEKKIADLEASIELNKKILESYIQEMSFSSSDDPTVNFAVSNDLLSEFSGNFDDMVSIKEKVLSVMDQIKKDKSDLSDAKDELNQKKQEKQDYLAGKQAQQVQVATKIQRAQATISELNARLNSLRSKLSSLLGEGVSMDDIKKAASIASDATGVRKDFILGELVVESDLGRFTGGCYYDKGSHPVKNHMHSYDKTDYLNLIDDLGYGKNDKKLSCWPGYGYGGALGIAQFMPSTWLGYSKRISKATGHDTPDPWNVVDGITGMAIKLANAGANHKSGEHTASKIYYCGGPSSAYWKTKCEDYADNVQYWADNYEKAMD